jgi:hypothetical protein
MESLWCAHYVVLIWHPISSFTMSAMVQNLGIHAFWEKSDMLPKHGNEKSSGYTTI